MGKNNWRVCKENPCYGGIGRGAVGEYASEQQPGGFDKNLCRVRSGVPVKA